MEKVRIQVRDHGEAVRFKKERSRVLGGEGPGLGQIGQYVVVGHLHLSVKFKEELSERPNVKTIKSKKGRG